MVSGTDRRPSRAAVFFCGTAICCHRFAHVPCTLSCLLAGVRVAFVSGGTAQKLKKPPGACSTGGHGLGGWHLPPRWSRPPIACVRWNLRYVWFGCFQYLF